MVFDDGSGGAEDMTGPVGSPARVIELVSGNVAGELFRLVVWDCGKVELRTGIV